MAEPESRKSRVSMLAVKSASNTKSLANMSLSKMKFRKQSFGFTGVPGIKPVERTSQVGFEFKRPALLFLPTYQLGSYKKFHLESVQKLVEEIATKNFEKHKYNIQGSPALALSLSGEVMREVKAMNFNRYRVITVVTIGQRRSQCYNNAIAFIWDHDTDNYVNVQRETCTAFLQITLFVVYLD